MLDALFNPRSVAVIGASNNPLTIGSKVVRNLLEHGFRGPVYPVNPKASAVEGLRAYPSIGDVPGEIDLVNISVNKTLVPGLVEECGRRGVKFVIIHTAGFKETGEEGRRLERRVVDVAREHGLRVFGPNSQGIQNSDAAVSVYADFTFTPMSPGTISIVAQSGGVGETLKLHLHRLGRGLRMYAGFGNESDVSLGEIIDHYGRDPGTKVIMAHVENFNDPAAFLAAASRAARSKPLLVLKTGRSAEGRRAAASHTGALVERDALAEALIRKSGALRFLSQEDMVQAALAFSLQPIPRGGRVAVLTNTGGPAVIAVDECAASGLSLARLSPATEEALRKALPPEASVSNPVDVLATAGPEAFGRSAAALLGDPEVDSLLLIFVTAPFVDCAGIARSIGAAARGAVKPVLSQVITLERESEVARLFAESGIPVHEFAETAARTMAALTRRGRSPGPASPPSARKDVRRAEAAAIIGRHRESGRFLPPYEVQGLLEAYGIPSVPTRWITDRTDLERVSRDMVYPLVLKASAEAMIHKTDRGGVALDLRSREELLACHEAMSGRLSGENPSFYVQEYKTGGREVFIGAKANEGLPPLILFGSGGVFVEALGDVQVRLAPLAPDEILDMIRSSRGYAVLEGLRGRKPADIDWLADVLSRLSQLAEDFPEIDEIDLNPVLVFDRCGKGAVADARVKVKGSPAGG